MEALSDPAPVPALADVETSIIDGVARSLDPRSVQLEQIVGWITAAVLSLSLLIGLILVLWLAPLLGWAKGLLAGLWAALALALAWHAQRWPAIAHRHASYKLDAQGIEIRRGVYWRSVIHVPRSRVQHTDVSQGPLQRSHGLGTLVLYTAGTDHAQVDLHGLDHDLALRIRDQLLPQEDTDAV